jgi:hypothetical protein
MSSTLILPRQIQTIIDEAVPKALKLHSEFKNKEKSLASIDNHLNSNTLPRSLQLKLELQIPKNILNDQKYLGRIENAQNIFTESLKTFQREATNQMRVVAEAAVDAAKHQFLDFISSTDNDIIIFCYRLLEKIDPAKANQFKIDMDQYPNVPIDNRTFEVCEVHEFIQSWRTAYSVGLRTKLAKEVENEIKTERKLSSKEAAEEVIMGDANNELVRDIVRRELQPIRTSLQRLNKSTVEKPSSTGKQKDSKPSSSVSWQNPVSEPADAKSAGRGGGQKRSGGGTQPTKPARGRDKKTRTPSPSPDRRKPSSRQSTQSRRQERTRSASSDSRQSRN